MLCKSGNNIKYCRTYLTAQLLEPMYNIYKINITHTRISTQRNVFRILSTCDTEITYGYTMDMQNTCNTDTLLLVTLFICSC